MADNQRKPPKDPDVFSDAKLHLFAKAPLQEGARTPRLKWKKIENNPAIEVDTGLKTEGRNGKEGYPIKIETPMEPKAARILLLIIERMAAYKGEMSLEIENWGHPFIYDRDQGKNVRSKERLVVSRFQISKRADGVVTFAVAAPKKPDVVFEFEPNEFHPILQNGQKVNVSLSSELAAQAWAEEWGRILPLEFATNWKEPEFAKARRLENMQRNQQGGGGQQRNYTSNNNGGGGGGNNNFGGGQQQPAPAPSFNDSFDEELPF